MPRRTPEPLQQYRGTTAQHAAYTGPVGEITVDTTKKTVVVQDGVTAGGHPLAKESTTITASNGVEISAGGTLGQNTTVSGVSASTSAPGVVQLNNATDSTAQNQAATPKAVSDALQAAKDYADSHGGGTSYTGTAPIVVSGSTISVSNATASSKGVVSVGTNLSISSGVLSVATATTTAKGVVQVGSNISVSSGTISVASGSTSTAGIVQLSNSTSSTSTTTAATPKAVSDALQAAKDYADGKTGGAVQLKSTRTTSGTWTITGLSTGKPLFILHAGGDALRDGVELYVTSGSNDGTATSGTGGFVRYSVGNSAQDRSTNAFICVPTASSVTIALTFYNNNANTLRAYQ